MREALKGIRVLDFTRLLPGPLCSMYLADYGADVVKVEDPQMGDYARDMEPMLSGVGALYQLLNRDKRSITLNLGHEEARAAARKLIADADVVLESFRPGVMRKFGLDYETMRELNPRLIYVSLTGYGQTGPYAKKAGHDLNFIGFTGLLHETIHARGKAQAALPAVQIADIGGGALHAVNAVLLALVKRGVSGEGAYLDVAMTDGVLPFMIPPLGYHLAGQESGVATFNPLTGSLACYDVYETQDGQWMALGALEEKFWKRFCEVAEIAPRLPDHWAADKQAAIREDVSAYFQAHTRAELVDRFAAEDVCLTPVLSIAEAMADPHMTERAAFWTRPDANAVTEIKNPLLDRAAADASFPPARGLHTDEVLRAYGYEDDVLRAFRERGII